MKTELYVVKKIAFITLFVIAGSLILCAAEMFAAIDRPALRPLAITERRMAHYQDIDPNTFYYNEADRLMREIGLDLTGIEAVQAGKIRTAIRQIVEIFYFRRMNCITAGELQDIIDIYSPFYEKRRQDEFIQTAISTASQYLHFYFISKGLPDRPTNFPMPTFRAAAAAASGI